MSFIPIVRRRLGRHKHPPYAARCSAAHDTIEIYRIFYVCVGEDGGGGGVLAAAAFVCELMHSN